MSTKTEIKDTLVAIMNNKSDLKIAQEKNWYRIPVTTKTTPSSVKDGSLKYISFYQTSKFGKKAFQIEWYGRVKNISVIKRKELFPELPKDPKAMKEYYKIEFENLIYLLNPIISKRHRRMLFVNTTIQKLLNSTEFNDLFIESPIEEKLWNQFKEEKIDAERQYIIQSKERFYYLDFALFCKERNLNVECDGDRFHLSARAVKSDKIRNNALTRLGWIVLRYTSEQINYNVGDVIGEVKETVNRYGVIETKFDLKKYEFFQKENNEFNLFD